MITFSAFHISYSFLFVLHSTILIITGRQMFITKYKLHICTNLYIYQLFYYLICYSFPPVLVIVCHEKIIGLFFLQKPLQLSIFPVEYKYLQSFTFPVFFCKGNISKLSNFMNKVRIITVSSVQIWWWRGTLPPPKKKWRGDIGLMGGGGIPM